MDAYIDRIYYASGGHINGAQYYYRVVRRGDGKIWDDVAKAFSDTTTWAASAISMSEKGTTGEFPVVIPADFPADTYDIIIYTWAGSSPANTDDVSSQYNAKVGSIFGF